MSKLRKVQWTALAGAVGTLTIASCRMTAAPDEDLNKVANEVVSLPPLRVVEPPVDRERLLLNIAQAASAYAAGTDDAEVQRQLDGKRFEVRLRFGCGEPSGDSADKWTFDPQTRTVRLRAVPDISLDDPLVRTLAGESVEAVEGFWLKRPWLLKAACPVHTPAASPEPRAEASATGGTLSQPKTTPPELSGRIGIAQFFTSTDRRTGRRSARPYEAVKSLDEGQELGREGFDLILSGRLRVLTDRRVVHCTGSDPDRPPDCIVSADIDRVRVEMPDSGTLLAEWTS